MIPSLRLYSPAPKTEARSISHVPKGVVTCYTAHFHSSKTMTILKASLTKLHFEDRHAELEVLKIAQKISMSLKT